MNTPIDYKICSDVIDSFHLPDFNLATIREIVAITNEIEKLTGEKFVRMEMGVPGLPAASVGIEAEIAALKSGCASIYPMLDGHPDLKQQAARFIKAFINIDIKPAHCIPVTGSMQGTYASFIVSGQRDKSKNTVLFIDPGFPVQKNQLAVIGLQYKSLDVYSCRGKALISEIESILKGGNICTIVYSNPNNPSWVCLTEEELEGIGKLATQYDVIVLEDLAYFAMDFRKELGEPFKAPYQPSVAKYTDNYLLAISGSKAFSYAGQRIGVVAISDKLYDRVFPDLKERYVVGGFGNVFVNRVLYCLSSGTAHSAQYALAAMFKAAADGEFRFLDDVKEYGRRAERLKKIFLANGFKLVYDKDGNEPIADGFYFTITYGNMSSGELMKELIYYGVSMVSIGSMGSNEQGLRACTSFIKPEQYEILEQRMQLFNQNHPLK